MSYRDVDTNIRTGLVWLDANAKHAIELKESFTHPAYNKQLREFINGSRATRFYGLCLNSIYFELIITLMRMYDTRESGTACFGNIFKWLTKDFITWFESKNNREISQVIATVRVDYKKLISSHVMGRLRTVRHNMYAHTSTSFNRTQVARYGNAEKLLEDTLVLLNGLNTSIFGKPEPYDKLKGYWKGYSECFWDIYLK